MVQKDDQIVCVSWLAIPSDRQPYVASDISFYEVQYYIVGSAVQNPDYVQTVRYSLTINLTTQLNSEMVLAVRVRGVTQLRREPSTFGFGPWSEVMYSGPVPRECK